MVDAEFLSNKGLIYKVCKDQEELNTESLAFAKRVSSKGPVAVFTAKAAIQKGFDLKQPDALTLEQQEFALLFGTKEASEGMAAFVEKRKPEY